MPRDIRLYLKNPELIPQSLMERPEQIPEDIWKWLPALPFEFPGWCAILPLPRVILETICRVPGAEVKVSNLVISPTEVNPGQVVTISCTVVNIGSEAGSYTVKMGGDFVAEQTVTLAPGESKTVSFQVTPAAAKTYSVSVNGLSGTFRATTAAVADIRVENLVISPTEVQVGQKVTISVTAKNYGTTAGTRTITCNVT